VRVRGVVYRHTDHAVGLTMLAQSSVRKEGKSPQIKLVFRDPATINLIPNYEGQPMIQYFYLLSPLHISISRYFLYFYIRIFHHRHRAALEPPRGWWGVAVVGEGWLRARCYDSQDSQGPDQGGGRQPDQ